MQSNFINTLEIEAASLDISFRSSPSLAPFFRQSSSETRAEDLRLAYLRYLKVTADYVKYTVPMLNAAGRALADGDATDQLWSQRFLSYSVEETDSQEQYGHHIWAQQDMAALGARPHEVHGPESQYVSMYGCYFVEHAKYHPYAILGCKAVLEHLSVNLASDFVDGLMHSQIQNVPNAIRFVSAHGTLDVEHVSEGNQNLLSLESPSKRQQVLEGAFFTSGCYRAFLAYEI